MNFILFSDGATEEEAQSYFSKSLEVCPASVKGSAQKVTAQLLADLNIPYNECPFQIRNRLDYFHAVDMQMKHTSSKSSDHKQAIIGLMAGRVIRDSRMRAALARTLGTSTKRIRGNATPTTEKPIFKRESQAQLEKVRSILAFYNSDEVSKQCPGVRDFTVINGEKVQNRILLDYVYIMFQRYKQQHPDQEVGKTLFNELRPDNIKLTSSIETASCLCARHENFSLLCRALNPFLEVKMATNPDRFVAELSSIEAVEAFLAEHLIDIDLEQLISVKQWMVVTLTIPAKSVNQKPRTIQTTRNPAIERSIQWVIDNLKKQYPDFKTHSDRIASQYAAMQEIKDKLRDGGKDIFIITDFAENYTCRGFDREATGMYYSASSASLFTICMYYKMNGELLHQSFVMISDVLTHNAAFVDAAIKILLLYEIEAVMGTEFREMMEQVHYLSDGPTSQYKNVFTGHRTAYHLRIYKLKGRWHFSVAGHGKSVCDGIGAIIKRLAMQASKHGYNISSPYDMYLHLKKNEKSIRIVWLSEAEFNVAEEDRKTFHKSLRGIPGNNKMHTIVPGKEPGQIYTCITSCYCTPCQNFKFEDCLGENPWMKHQMVKPKPKPKPPAADDDADWATGKGNFASMNLFTWM